MFSKHGITIYHYIYSPTPPSSAFLTGLVGWLAVLGSPGILFSSWELALLLSLSEPAFSVVLTSFSRLDLISSFILTCVSFLSSFLLAAHCTQLNGSWIGTETLGPCLLGPRVLEGGLWCPVGPCFHGWVLTQLVLTLWLAVSVASTPVKTLPSLSWCCCLCCWFHHNLKSPCFKLLDLGDVE